MQDNKEKLLALKAKIEKKKTKHSELKGRKAELMKNLKEKFDCSTVAAAQKKLAKMKKEFDSLTNEIEEGMSQLKEDYDL